MRPHVHARRRYGRYIFLYLLAVASFAISTAARLHRGVGSPRFRSRTGARPTTITRTESGDERVFTDGRDDDDAVIGRYPSPDRDAVVHVLVHVVRVARVTLHPAPLRHGHDLPFATLVQVDHAGRLQWRKRIGISRAIDLPTADRFQSRPAHVRVAADLHADGVTVVRPRAEPQRTGVLAERPVGQVHFAEHPVPGRRYPVHGAVGPDHAVGLAVRLVVVPVGAVENASRPRRPAVTTIPRGLYR